MRVGRERALNARTEAVVSLCGFRALRGCFGGRSYHLGFAIPNIDLDAAAAAEEDLAFPDQLTPRPDKSQTTRSALTLPHLVMAPTPRYTSPKQRYKVYDLHPYKRPRYSPHIADSLSDMCYDYYSQNSWTADNSCPSPRTPVAPQHPGSFHA